MTEEIIKIDNERIAVRKTEVTDQIIAKVTLEAQKTALLEQIAEIDTKLLLFK